MDDWKRLDMDSKPKDIATGGYEFKYSKNATIVYYRKSHRTGGLSLHDFPPELLNKGKL